MKILRRRRSRKPSNPFKDLVGDIWLGVGLLVSGSFCGAVGFFVILERLTRGNIRLLMTAQVHMIRLSLVDVALVLGLICWAAGALWIDRALKKYKRNAWLLEY